MFDRIVRNPGILGGKPIIRGTRLSVEHILELFASRGTLEAILERYPHLTTEDVSQAMLYAANSPQLEPA